MKDPTIPYISLSQVVKEFCLAQFNDERKYFINYMVHAKWIWKDLFLKSIYAVKSKYVEVDFTTNPYSIVIPKDMVRFINISYEDEGGSLRSFVYDDNINDVQIPTGPECVVCGTTNDYGDCVSNIIPVIKAVTLLGATYNETIWQKINEAGDLVEVRQVPVIDFGAATPGRAGVAAVPAVPPVQSKAVLVPINNNPAVGDHVLLTLYDADGMSNPQTVLDYTVLPEDVGAIRALTITDPGSGLDDGINYGDINLLNVPGVAGFQARVSLPPINSSWVLVAGNHVTVTITDADGVSNPILLIDYTIQSYNATPDLLMAALISAINNGVYGAFTDPVNGYMAEPYTTTWMRITHVAANTAADNGKQCNMQYLSQGQGGYFNSGRDPIGGSIGLNGQVDLNTANEQVNSVTITNPGQQYQPGDKLFAYLPPPGFGAALTVSATTYTHQFLINLAAAVGLGPMGLGGTLGAEGFQAVADDSWLGIRVYKGQIGGVITNPEALNGRIIKLFNGATGVLAVSFSGSIGQAAIAAVPEIPAEPGTVIMIIKERRVCSLDIKPCGCVRKTPANKDLIQRCCGVFLQDNNLQLLKPSPRQAATRDGRMKVKNGRIWLRGRVDKYMILSYQTNGSCPEEEIMVPEYSVNSLMAGIDWRSTAFAPNKGPQITTQKRIAYDRQVEEMDEFLNPVRAEEFMNVQMIIPLWGEGPAVPQGANISTWWPESDVMARLKESEIKPPSI